MRSHTPSPLICSRTRIIPTKIIPYIEVNKLQTIASIAHNSTHRVKVRGFRCIAYSLFMIATPKRLINSSPPRTETRVTIGPNIQLEVNIQQNKQVAKKRNVMSWINFIIPILITSCVVKTVHSSFLSYPLLISQLGNSCNYRITGYLSGCFISVDFQCQLPCG